ncbi:MAG: heat-inducible transcriptional repressor HrcA [Tissierellia bacterium]|nr:heat-inducible transcriptional repressor HrcA [Tissierellia bacterium]
MDTRKIQILNAIINSYIDLPIPVGSRTLSKEFDFGVSSATIRNEMADLEDLGYLNKPHQSAGRIPSDKAYRFYVDELYSKYEGEDNGEKVSNLKETISEDIGNYTDLFQRVVHRLAEQTNCTSYLIAPKKPDTTIKLLKLIALDDSSILLLIIGNKGIVEKHILNIRTHISEPDLAVIEKRLNDEISGMDFGKIEELKITLTGRMVEFGNFISSIIKKASKFNNKVSAIEVYYDGLTNILNFEEYKDLEKAREFMTFIEDKDLLLDILRQKQPTKDLEVIIGDENDYDLMKGNSIIRSTYRSKNNLVGSLGIIGPVRMDYRNLIRTVHLYSNAMAQIMEEL